MKKNFLFYLLPSVVKGALGIGLVIPVATYYLDPEDFGIAAILEMISGLIDPLSAMGIVWVLSAHYYKASVEDQKKLLFNVLFLDTVLRLFWVVLFGLAATTVLPWIIRDFSPEYLFYFQLSLIGILLNGIWPSVSYALVLQKKGKIHFFLETGQYLVAAAGMIVCLVMLRLKTITLFLIPIITGSFSTLLALWFIRQDIVPRISKKWIQEIYKVGMSAIPFNLFELIGSTIDRYFVQRFINLYELGIYAHSKSYQQVFIMGSKAFDRTVVPEILQVFLNNKDKNILKGTLTLWYGLLGIGGLFITAFSYEILNILTHGKFVAAAPLLPIWFLLLFWSAFGTTYSQYLAFHKKTVFLAYSGIGITLFFIGVNAASVFYLGIMGAAVAVISSNGVVQLSRRIYAKKLGCDPVAEKEFLTAVLLLLGIYGITLFFEPDFYSRLLLFVVGSFAFIIYFGLVTAVKNNSRLIMEQFGVWKRKMP